VKQFKSIFYRKTEWNCTFTIHLCERKQLTITYWVFQQSVYTTSNKELNDSNSYIRKRSANVIGIFKSREIYGSPPGE